MRAGGHGRMGCGIDWEERWFFYGDSCCSAGRFAVPHRPDVPCAAAAADSAERAARAVPVDARTDDCRAAARAGAYRPAGGDAFRHRRAAQYDRAGAAAKQPAAGRRRPYLAGADAGGLLRAKAGDLCSQRLCVPQYRPAGAAQNAALFDVLIGVFLWIRQSGTHPAAECGNAHAHGTAVWRDAVACADHARRGRPVFGRAGAAAAARPGRARRAD